MKKRVLFFLLYSNCISLGPLSDSHLASGLDTRACDWMVWKEWGEGWVSVFWGKVRGHGPLTTHVKAWLTHTLHHLNKKVCSLLSAICPHLHIKQRPKWPNAGIDAKQTQCLADTVPSSDLALTWRMLLTANGLPKKNKRNHENEWICSKTLTFQANCTS